MPGVVIDPRSSDEIDRWGPAVQKGTEDGLDAAVDVLRRDAQAALASATDPWGAAVAPLSPVTLKLYAQLPEDRVSIAGGIRSYRDPGKLKLSFRGRLYPVAYVKQFGNPDNRMFDEAPAPIPARPFLAVRYPGAVPDLPMATKVEILALLKRGIAQAIASEQIGGGSRRRR